MEPALDENKWIDDDSSINMCQNRKRTASIVRRFQGLFVSPSATALAASNDKEINGDDKRNGNPPTLHQKLIPQIPFGPKNFESLKSEDILCGVISAFPHLKFSSLKIHVSSPSLPSPKDFWSILMENFESAVDMGLQYVSLLPGINLIRPHDRRRIFSECLLPMAAVQQILMTKPNCSSPVPGDLFFLNMTPQARALFVSYFPVYQVLVKETYDIGVAIASWAPSNVEIAFLEALLFYYCDAPGLENPMAVEQLRNQLLRTIEAHLQSTCSEEKAASVMEQLMSVYKLLMKLPEVHAAVLSQMAEANPEIIQQSQLLHEVYPENARSPTKIAPKHMATGLSS